jgi:hypothetical protein
MEHSLRVDVGGNSTTAINAGNLVPLSGTRKNTTAGLGELRWARRAGVSAVASSAEIAHGRLRRIIRYDKPARCFLLKRLVHLTYPVPTQSLFYTSSPSSSGSASTTLLAITFSFSQQQQTTRQTHTQPSASSHQQHQKQPHSLRHCSRHHAQETFIQLRHIPIQLQDLASLVHPQLPANLNSNHSLRHTQSSRCAPSRPSSLSSSRSSPLRSRKNPPTMRPST